MKTILASLAVATAVAVPAHAATTTEAAQIKIERYAPNADVSALTDTQVASILNAINSQDSHSERSSIVESLLRQYQ